MLAAGVIYGATGVENLMVLKPQENLHVWRAVAVEALMTFVYAFVFFAFLDQSKSKASHSANLGAAVFVASLFAVSLFLGKKIKQKTDKK